MIHKETLFNDKSDLYAKARPTYPPAIFDFIAAQCDHHDRVWDCATGNGQAALGLSKKFASVHATDISPEQIANHLHIPKAQFSVMPAETSAFKSGWFDAVNVAQALHWFNLDLYWPEVKRVLKPDGLFVTYSYDWFVISQEIDLLIEEHVKSIIAPYWAPQNQLVLNQYRDVVFPFKKLAVPDLHIQVQWDLNGLMNYLHTWSATRRCMQDIGDGFFKLAEQKIGQAWGDRAQLRDAYAPLTIIAGYPNQENPTR